MSEREIFSCSCHDPDHLLIFDTDGDFEEDLVVYLKHNSSSFWKRLKFLFSSKEFVFSEIILHKNEQKRLLTFMKGLNIE